MAADGAGPVEVERPARVVGCRRVTRAVTGPGFISSPVISSPVASATAVIATAVAVAVSAAVASSSTARPLPGLILIGPAVGRFFHQLCERDDQFHVGTTGSGAAGSGVVVSVEVAVEEFGESVGVAFVGGSRVAGAISGRRGCGQG